ncbi:unnamed protein product [Rotaria magnacalcarata]|uniref:Protein kinase domain-containing protein n=3 Tax=Rotaria magnacalcarata TaxID=392030 RepID=A0A816C027_9BILA|nr:unnamed protein product [Rotaria magnacalcarata]CAF2115050.1 unnamed protein product [Rotaria magnacalcarata]
MTVGDDRSQTKEIITLQSLIVQEQIKQQEQVMKRKLIEEKEALKRKLIQEKEATKRKLIEEKEATKRKLIEEKEVMKRKLIEEKEATKRKRIQEQEKTKRKKLEIIKIHEDELRKPMERSFENEPSSSDDSFVECSFDTDIDNDSIKKNICPFDINFMLQENNHFNESIENCIKDYMGNALSCVKKIENEYQNEFDQLMLKLLRILHERTSLLYLNTQNKKYLEGKSPDCTFIFNDINVNIKKEDNYLQDFVVIIGDVKEPTKSIDDTQARNEILTYLQLLLNKQRRNKIYGFLTNIKCIKFFYVQKNSNFCLYDYFESPTLNTFDYLFDVTPSMHILTTNTSIIGQSKNISLNKETWIIFTKFLIMQKDFYEYTTLNISYIDILLPNRYSIEKKLGKGSTSNVYLLEKTESNTCIDDPEHCVIKICRQNEYSLLYLNEMKMINELKRLNISNKFNLFFEDIIHLSPAENVLLFKNELESIKTLPLIQSKQLIDIIQYLYDCNVIHRDLSPQNLMLDGHIQQLKLIDFGLASKYEKDEITKQLPINGTIAFGGHEFLRFISNLPLDSIKSQFYAYERTFDLKSALHVIMYMNDNNVQLKMKSIQKVEYFIDKTTQTLTLWKALQQNNKYYSNLLNLIDDSIQSSSTFEVIKKKLEKFI